MKSIKETKEILEGVKEGFKVGKAIRDIVADGVDQSDLMPAFDLIRKQAAKLDVYAAAVEDAHLAKEELQDLEKDEIIELFMIVVEGVNEVDKA